MATFNHGGPPSHGRRQYDLLRVGAGKCVTFRSLNETWVDVLTHFNGRTTLVCPETPECDQCRQGRQQVWKGYILGQSMTSNNCCVIELTANAAFNLIDDPLHGETLVGAIISLSRQGNKPNGVLKGKILAREKNVEAMPVEFCEHSVRSIYRHHKPAWESTLKVVG